ncbi:hypothetical protein EDC01DRAFT_635355 [Geopyxis carbonaria]|nr:hypothetical protein EDC01DRAFT_635355 [Geopyxis carbonaria]
MTAVLRVEDMCNSESADSESMGHQNSTCPEGSPTPNTTSSNTFSKICILDNCASPGPYTTKAAYDRHIGKHTQPYKCPHNHCPRHQNGFSRIDNLKTHLRNKEHEGQTCCTKNNATPPSPKSPTIHAGGVRGKKKSRQDKKQQLIEHVLLLATKLIAEVDSSDDDNESDDERTLASSCTVKAEGSGCP